MQRLGLFTFVTCCAVAALVSAANVQKDSKPPGTVSPAQEFTPTAPSTTIKSTTPAPHNTTTPAPHNTTTPAPHNTTTTGPSNATTTVAPHNATTVAPHNTTTTVAPHNTTTVTPPPPGPTPPTNLTTGKYFVNETGKVCVMAEMALQIRLKNGKENGTFIIQPSKTRASGSCQGTSAVLTLSFTEGAITFSFNKNVTDNSVYVDTLAFNLSYSFTKGSNQQYSASNKSLHLFTTKVGHSYSCKAESLYMGKGLYLDVSKDRMQAFNVTKSAEFGPPDYCPADQDNYRVAIAVGITLLVLIIVVIVAYLLGRKKRNDGYQSL
ncbi:LOW QUALITY PROTEIN: macrosialin [Mugil cephalus]|uniref:LOW QUALITY PROTEIN: macrosialin n=1 Tax=Mugil cephalus TaxID=48193 RepID=UPI001FB6F011|nr:LOW QUALITY PROTEIN: macrosialin [Mugil cephalus]